MPVGSLEFSSLIAVKAIIYGDLGLCWLAITSSRCAIVNIDTFESILSFEVSKAINANILDVIYHPFTKYFVAITDKRQAVVFSDTDTTLANAKRIEFNLQPAELLNIDSLECIAVRFKGCSSLYVVDISRSDEKVVVTATKSSADVSVSFTKTNLLFCESSKSKVSVRNLAIEHSHFQPQQSQCKSCYQLLNGDLFEITIDKDDKFLSVIAHGQSFSVFVTTSKNSTKWSKFSKFNELLFSIELPLTGSRLISTSSDCIWLINGKYATALDVRYGSEIQTFSFSGECVNIFSVSLSSFSALIKQANLLSSEHIQLESRAFCNLLGNLGKRSSNMPAPEYSDVLSPLLENCSRSKRLKSNHTTTELLSPSVVDNFLNSNWQSSDKNFAIFQFLLRESMVSISNRRNVFSQVLHAKRLDVVLDLARFANMTEFEVIDLFILTLSQDESTWCKYVVVNDQVKFASGDVSGLKVTSFNVLCTFMRTILQRQVAFSSLLLSDALRRVSTSVCITLLRVFAQFLVDNSKLHDREFVHLCSWLDAILDSKFVEICALMNSNIELKFVLKSLMQQIKQFDNSVDSLEGLLGVWSQIERNSSSKISIPRTTLSNSLHHVENISF